VKPSNKPPAAPKFRRAAPEARRAELIEATLRCLRKYGHEGVSVRHISAEAGVSMGLINHHFPGSASLIAAAYDYLATSMLEATRRSAESIAGTPRARLHQFFQASFAPDILDPGVFRIWLVFWSMVAHSDEMRAVHDRTNARTREALESLLGELATVPGVPAFKVHPAAIALSALMDGLWVELSLNPEAFQSADAIALCTDWVVALEAGAFPGLRTGLADRVTSPQR
jgi:AcrR family transcriptional regulator